MQINIDTKITDINELKRVFKIIQEAISKKENKNNDILNKIAKSNYGLKK